MAVLLAGLAGRGSVRAAVPANDDFANASVLVAGGGTATADNVDATKEAGEPNHAGDQGGSIDTVGSSFDTLLAVYTGNTVSTLTTVGSNDDVDHSGSVSRVWFTVTAATTYKIGVDGYDADSGSITLNYGPKNDSAPCPTLSPAISGTTRPTVGDVLVPSSRSFADADADADADAGGAAPSYQWVRCAEQLRLTIDAATNVARV